MIVNVRPRTLKTRVLLFSMAFGAVLMGVTMPAAKAAPTVGDVAMQNASGICGLLTHEPTFTGVDEVMGQLLAQGWTTDTTAAVMSIAIHSSCPKFDPLFLEWAHHVVAPPVSEVYRA